VITGGADGTLKVWSDAGELLERWLGHIWPIIGLAELRNGTFTSIDAGGSIRCWPDATESGDLGSRIKAATTIRLAQPDLLWAAIDDSRLMLASTTGTRAVVAKVHAGLTCICALDDKPHVVAVADDQGHIRVFRLPEWLTS